MALCHVKWQSPTLGGVIMALCFHLLPPCGGFGLCYITWDGSVAMHRVSPGKNLSYLDYSEGKSTVTLLRATQATNY